MTIPSPLPLEYTSYIVYSRRFEYTIHIAAVCIAAGSDDHTIIPSYYHTQYLKNQSTSGDAFSATYTTVPLRGDFVNI